MLHKNTVNSVNQITMVSVDQLVPEDHILRKIDKTIDFDFIYDLVEDKYSHSAGRPSIDPVVLFKLVFIQYLFGIKSMRQTVKEVEVNISYRWFLDFGFTDPIPHYSTFSQNYIRRFGPKNKDESNDIFRQIFENILLQAYQQGYVDTKLQFVDSTHIKAHANRHKTRKVPFQKVAKTYQAQLDKEVNNERKKIGKKPFDPKDDDPGTPGGPEKESPTKQSIESTSDPESGLFHKGPHKEVFAYVSQTSCDKHGWLINFAVYPGNRHDSTTFFHFYQNHLKKTHPTTLVMDAGYKTAAITKRLIDDGIQPVLPYTRPKGNSRIKFTYLPETDRYICPEGYGLNYTTVDREGHKIYRSNSQVCMQCPHLKACTTSQNMQRVKSRHLWQDYVDQCDHFRQTPEGKALYKQRAETIERQFGNAKEQHGLRYTNMVGKAKCEMKVALTFACQNMKKLALKMTADGKTKQRVPIGATI